MHIDQIGRILQYLRISILAVFRVFDIFMAFGQWFHNLAASMWKLLSAFFVLHQSKNTLSGLFLVSLSVVGTKCLFSTTGYSSMLTDFHVSMSLICAASWLTDNN